MTAKILTSRAQAEKVLNSLTDSFAASGIRWEVCGSYRRGKEVLGDLDLLIAANEKGREIILRSLDSVMVEGPRKIRGIYKNMQVDFMTAFTLSWGAARLHCTGSREFNIKMRVKAKSLGMSLNEYGLMRKGRALESETEEEIFKALKMAYVKPEERE